MVDKVISKRTHVWSHVAVIAFHVIIGALLLFYSRNQTLVKVLGAILVIVSLLGLTPILSDWDRIIIE